MEKPNGLGVNVWEPIVNADELGRAIVLLPITTSDGPKEIRVPETTIAGPPCVTAVPSIENTGALGETDWSDGDAVIGIVLKPTTRPDGPRLIRVFEIVIGGPPLVTVCPSMAKAEEPAGLMSLSPEPELGRGTVLVPMAMALLPSETGVPSIVTGGEPNCIVVPSTTVDLALPVMVWPPKTPKEVDAAGFAVGSAIVLEPIAIDEPPRDTGVPWISTGVLALIVVPSIAAFDPSPEIVCPFTTPNDWGAAVGIAAVLDSIAIERPPSDICVPWILTAVFALIVVPSTTAFEPSPDTVCPFTTPNNCGIAVGTGTVFVPIAMTLLALPAYNIGVPETTTVWPGVNPVPSIIAPAELPDRVWPPITPNDVFPSGPAGAGAIVMPFLSIGSPAGWTVLPFRLAKSTGEPFIAPVGVPPVTGVYVVPEMTFGVATGGPTTGVYFWPPTT